MLWKNGLKSKVIFGFLLTTFFVLPLFVLADYEGQKTYFFVNQDFDYYSRDKLQAELVSISTYLYFYIEQDYWQNKSSSEQRLIQSALNELAAEFQNHIYPELTSVFGSEWRPGIDQDVRITILFHQMQGGAAGYYNSGDEYLKVEYPESNEREMIYLNPDFIGTSIIKSYLAHEFTHLITFNEKERLFNVAEDTWLHEARSEMAIALLGYNDNYSGSNLQQRVNDFLQKPNDSLCEWQGKTYDYGVLNLFAQYLVGHYGTDIFSKTLKMGETGIASLNQFLEQSGYEEDFTRVFTDWTIASLVNDCSLGSQYCYQNNNLREFQVVPTTNFLPFSGKSSLEVSKTTKSWAGNWEKFVGGSKNLKLDFQAPLGGKFKVPYLIKNSKGAYSLDFLDLNGEGRGIIYVPDFNAENEALIILPSAQNKMFDFGANDPAFEYSFTASIIEKQDMPSEREKLIEALKVQIELLKRQIAAVQAQIRTILGINSDGVISCQSLNNNLYLGFNGGEVECLQEFLKNQGAEIYSEGLVTGYFGPLTEQAVIRFQEKYKSEILAPWGLESGNGYVGPKTREKINSLLGNY